MAQFTTPSFVHFWFSFKTFDAILLFFFEAIVFGLTIAYASDNKSPATLAPLWIIPLTENLDHAIMFYVACAAAACLFMALIHVAILLFINDDYDTDPYESNKRDKKKDTHQHLNDSRIQNEYKNPAFQAENAVNQQNGLYRLEKSTHNPNKYKPNEPNVANPNYLGPNRQIYNHPVRNNIVGLTFFCLLQR